MRLGMVGLGRMGLGMSGRMIDGGHRVLGFDPEAGARERLVEAGGESAASLGDLVDGLTPPRVVWLMVPAGDPVDRTIEALGGLLDTGDTVVDGGNSDYRRTLERGERLAEQGVELVDAGTSGGVWGRREGYCLMLGGSGEAVERLRPALTSLAADGERGWAHVGERGAGHFVKMVHNGIEYGLMQAYAEGFSILRHKGDLGIDVERVAEVWRHGSVVRSWLLDLTARTLAEDATLEEIEPWVADSGEGRWAVREAIELDVPAPVISLSLIERLTSRDTDSYAHRLLAALRNQFGGHAIKRRS